MPPSEPLEFVVGRLLLAAQKTVGVAESCTGGLLGHRLTNVPGSSAYFMGGILAYAYGVKERVLGVSHESLMRYGAVSPQVAQEMAQRVRALLGVDIGLSVTGIAGPSGGTPDKPVGLTYVHLSAADIEWGEQHLWQGTRLENKVQSAEAALDLLCRYLSGALGTRAGSLSSLK